MDADAGGVPTAESAYSVATDRRHPILAFDPNPFHPMEGSPEDRITVFPRPEILFPPTVPEGERMG
eukprot:5042567-Karenia_brevis.AAC.1